MNYFNIFKPIYRTFGYSKDYFNFITKYFGIFITQSLKINKGNPRLVIWYRLTNNPNIGYNAFQIYLY